MSRNEYGIDLSDETRTVEKFVDEDENVPDVLLGHHLDVGPLEDHRLRQELAYHGGVHALDINIITRSTFSALVALVAVIGATLAYE